MPQLSEPGIQVLEHYGIKGMKWGIRRDRRVLDRLAGRNSSAPGSSDDGNEGKPPSKATSRRPSASSRDTLERARRRADAKNARNLSDRDLRGKIDRLKLERELKKLTNENLNPIQTRITQILTESGINVAKTVTTAAMKILVYKVAQGEKLTQQDIAMALAPGLKQKDKKK